MSQGPVSPFHQKQKPGDHSRSTEYEPRCYALSKTAAPVEMRIALSLMIQELQTTATQGGLFQQFGKHRVG